MEFCLAYLVMWMASASFFHNDDSNYHGGHQCHSSKWQGHVDRATATNIVIFNISYWITLKLKKQISNFAVTRWIQRIGVVMILIFLILNEILDIGQCKRKKDDMHCIIIMYILFWFPYNIYMKALGRLPF